MKSRREAASSMLARESSEAVETEVNSGPLPALARNCRQYTKPADPSVPTVAAAPNHNGHVAAAARDQPTAMHPKIATWTTLSLQKSRSPPYRDSWNFSRANSPSHPSTIEWSRNNNDPTSCQYQSEDRKNGAPIKPSAIETIVI